ncbi:MAG TPA: DUF4112 domain-containing protein [Gammaproteobacteria bacterium]|nr:DUF4112 domain-containing protein [Gammaproteobacteria bacterium]
MTQPFEKQPAPPSRSQVHELERLGQVLDSAFAIPGTPFRIGLDGILGFTPGVGDTMGAVLSTYIIFKAARLGVPRRVIVRMVGNVALDTVVGVIPMVGDIFDIAWKANVRNLALLRTHFAAPECTERSSRQIMTWLLVLLALAIVGLGILLILGLWLIYHFFMS